MKLKTIIVLSLIGCVWGGSLGHSVIIENRDKLALEPLFSMFNPQFVKEAETGGFQQLVFDQKKLRIGFVVTDAYCEAVESWRQKALSLRQKELPLRKSEKLDDLREAMSIASEASSIEAALPKSVPPVGEASFDWTGSGMSQTDQTVLRRTTYASGIVIGATFGFLCHLLVLLSIKAVTFGIRRSCNKVQLYLCAVFLPFLFLPLILMFSEILFSRMGWGEDGFFLGLLLWLFLVFFFEFMLFSSSSPTKFTRTKNRLAKNVESSARPDMEMVEKYEAEMIPPPPGIKPPEHFGYIHFKAYSYLKRGLVGYRRQDAFGMPPENTPLFILSVIEEGCRQIQEWRGITPESPLQGLGINGFYQLIELFHFKVIGQSASFGDDGTVMDKMTIKHVVSGEELTLYNKVNSPAKPKKTEESGELNAQPDRAGEDSKQNAIFGDQPIECPRCRLLNHPTATRCDCGYDFPTGSIKKSYVTRNKAVAQNTAKLDSMLAGLYSGGAGNSLQDAVIVNAPSSSIGVLFEYKYIQKQCGEKDVDWRIESQSLLEGAGRKPYDLMTVRLKDGTVRKFYFDISLFYGRRK